MFCRTYISSSIKLTIYKLHEKVNYLIMSENKRRNKVLSTF